MSQLVEVFADGGLYYGVRLAQPSQQIAVQNLAMWLSVVADLVRWLCRLGFGP